MPAMLPGAAIAFGGAGATVTTASMPTAANAAEAAPPVARDTQAMGYAHAATLARRRLRLEL